jgi:arylsulfatase A-like enzyme
LTACGGSSEDTQEMDSPVSSPEPIQENIIPIAQAGLDQNVEINSSITVNASNSSDADNDPLTYLWSFSSLPTGSTASLSNTTSIETSFTLDLEGDYQLSLIVDDGKDASIADLITFTATLTSVSGGYAIVDTGQELCYSVNTGETINCSARGEDADYNGNQASYTLSSDGSTITDNVTELIWQQSTDLTGDGELNYADKLSQSDALSYCESLTLAERDDWRLPSIKESYSLILFTGEDPSSYQGSDISSLSPFIDAKFDWAFGDIFTNDGISAGDRIIDGQYASSTIYVSTTMNGDNTMFGVNFVDGRIKGYPADTKKYYVRCVTGNTSYGNNDFIDNQDQTITDNATQLMWQKNDSESINWLDAIDQCQNTTTASYNDWRLPNAKELQSIVDYNRSPDTTNSAAINPIFNSTAIINEESITDWGYYWASTTHVDSNNDGSNATYISFGRALGYMNTNVLDVHGAGSQRSNDKVDVTTELGASSTHNSSATFYYKGPQGDILRTDNKFRCVRDIDSTTAKKIPTDGSKNILLIVGDDIGVDNISGYEEQVNYSAQTPNIDALAANGVLFRNAWANPMCSPSRASLLTGRHAFRHSVTHPGSNSGVLPSDEQTIAEALSSGGYQTALFGKWHLGEKSGQLPTDQGFSFYSGSLANITNYYSWQKTQVLGEGQTPITKTETGYASKVVTDEALDWIHSTTAPWFVEVAFNAPHSPFHVPPKDKFSHITLNGAQGDVCNDDISNDEVKDCYRAAAEAMDTYIGDLLNNLDATTLANTLVIFIGDNGTTREAIIDEAGLSFSKSHSKGTVYEGGINIPIIISGGSDLGVDKSEVTEKIQIQDLFSTILALANVTASNAIIDGQSLIGYLDNETPLPQARETLYSELFSTSQGIDRWAITNGEAKYIYNEAVEECYNILLDPREQKNEFGNLGVQDTHCAILKSLRPMP